MKAGPLVIEGVVQSTGYEYKKPQAFKKCIFLLFKILNAWYLKRYSILNLDQLT